jgi:putative cardiolipin synthase
MRRSTTGLAAAFVLSSLLAACATALPSLEDRGTTIAFTDTADTRLGRVLAPATAARPRETGVHALVRPRDAFAVRALLAAAADKSLDVQYYIWHGDPAGYMLFEALWLAAGRGVRVRLLLDDNNTRGLDPTLAALDAHPNIEVRLYNPFVQRSGRMLGYLTDFSRLNRRMHNKSFTADNQVTVVGGRNIGGEYFAVGSAMVFADLDVVAVGAAVSEVSKQFDVYWNSPSAYPAAGFVGASGPDGEASVKARFAAARADPESVAYLEAVRTTPVVRDILDRKLDFEWATARLVYDDPAKTLDRSERADHLLFPALVQAMGRPARTLDLVSPYFVPGEAGTESLAALARSGVRIRVLTNSLAGSDVAVVHAGYAKRRHDLLRAGIRLFELKPTATQELPADRTGVGSSSSSGLHAKTFAVDGSRIFVGSFNFDLRSALLNTEMGLVIDSPVLAGALSEGFESGVLRAAYEVVLAPDGRGLQWIERSSAGERRYDTEPETSWLRRAAVGVLSVLPIDWLL